MDSYKTCTTHPPYRIRNRSNTIESYQPKKKPNNSRGMKKTPAMEQHYAVLQKKLHELESVLNEIFFHSTEEVDYKSAPYDGITAKIGFLKTLLAAEMESNAEGTSHHLSHIATRLAALEDAFHNWVDFEITPEDRLGDLSVMCSCTHSCFNDVVEDDDSVPEPEYFVPMACKAEDLSSQGSEEDLGAERKTRRVGILPCAFKSAAVAVAAMVVMIEMATNFSREDEKAFLVPT